MGGLGWYFAKPEDWLAFEPGLVEKHTTLQTIPGLTQELDIWRRVGMEISVEQAARAMVENVVTPDAKVTITRGTVNAILKTPKVNTTRPPVAGTGPPLAAVMDIKLPKTLGRLALDLAIRKKDWEWVNDVWITPTLRDISRRLKTRGGNTVWVDWLRGVLPWTTPIVQGHGDLVGKKWAVGIQRAGWSKLLLKPRFNYTSVLSLAVRAEGWARVLTEQHRVRLGG
jgi:hypothetical protein